MRWRHCTAYAALVAAAACTSSGGGSARPAPSPGERELPRSMAALGDSMTRGFVLCEDAGDCPEASWATGSADEVDSHRARLARAAGRDVEAHNLAVSGATVSDLPNQVRRAVAERPDYVTILIGANDACAPSEDTITPVEDYTATFGGALGDLVRGLPDARILVVSIPDLQRLWEVGKDDPAVQAVWERGICQSMLADPTSTSADAEQRRTRVRERVVAYNAAMMRACERHPTCRSDRGAVFEHRFTLEMVSDRDYWHPSRHGQRTISEVAWQAGYWPAR